MPPINLPTLPPINLVPSPSRSPSFAIPSFAIPSFNTNGDPALAAKFPTTINGAPVTNVSTVNFVAFYQAFAGTDPETQANVQKLVTILQNGGIDPTTFVFGNASVDLDTGTEQIEAFHVPGSSGATLLGLFPQFAAISNNDETPPVIGTANVGGKTVTTVDDGTDQLDYLYPSGDVLWEVSTSSPDAAAAIMAAVQ